MTVNAVMAACTEMAHTRLYTTTNLCANAELELDAEQAHYIGRVLRLRVGDSLSAFNGNDGEFDAELLAISKRSARLKLGAHRQTETESELRIHLVQAVSRGDRMDFVVQKATELGVKRLSPVLSEYGVVKLDSKRADKRRDHWQQVAVSACEQSGRIRPPLVDLPKPLKSFFGEETNASDVDLILRPGAATAMAGITAPTTKVCLMIGPEGGFSDSEYADAELAGFQEVSLGPRILRTETAAIAALTLAQTLWGDLGLN